MKVLKESHRLHIYERVGKGNGKGAIDGVLYRCIDPHCTHNRKAEYILGKAALCPKCGVEFILSRMQLKNRLPVCAGCSKSPKPILTEVAKDVMKDIFDEINLLGDN